MKIIEVNSYRDGRTVQIDTDEGVFCFDGRIGSHTKGRLYNGYPMKDNSNLIEDFEELETKLIKNFISYKGNVESTYGMMKKLKN